MKQITSVHVIGTPGGTWGFAGRVPLDLAYTMADGSPLTDKVAQSIRLVGPGMVQRQGKIKFVIFETKESAEKALALYIATKERAKLRPEPRPARTTEPPRYMGGS